VSAWDRMKDSWASWTPDEVAKETEPMQSHTVRTQYVVRFQGPRLKKGECARVEVAIPPMGVVPRRLIVPGQLAPYFVIESFSLLTASGRRDEILLQAVPAGVFAETNVDSMIPFLNQAITGARLDVRCVRAEPWTSGLVHFFGKTFRWSWGSSYGRAPEFQAILMTICEETRAGPSPKCDVCGLYPCECEPPDSREDLEHD
jgi:hypothetical protein